MNYYIPDEVIAKAQQAYKNSPLPGTDAMACALRAIRQELATIVIDEYEFNKLISSD